MIQALSKLVKLLTPKRRWFQFSLLTMFFVVTAFGVWLGHWVDPVSKLCRQLHDPSEDVRVEAATRLGQLGSKARAAKSSLVGAFEDESKDVRCMAALAIWQIGGDWRVLVPLLDAEEDEAVRIAATQAIVRGGGDAGLVVCKLLASEAQDGNLAAVLPSFGPDPTLAAIPVLIEAVAGDDAALKKTANELLRECLPAPPVTAVPILTEYLAHLSPDVRIAAAEQLLRLGIDARRAAAALRQRLDDPDRRVGLAMAAALVAVDAAERELYLPVLIESLHPDDQEMRDHALYYCEELGPLAADAVGELMTLFDDDPDDKWYDFEKEWKEGRTALSLPERIGPASVPLLRKILSRGRPHARIRAAIQLVNLGPRVRRQVPELVPVLTFLLDDLDENDQRRVVWALGEIGKEAAPAVPRLVGLIKSDTDFKRRYIKYDSMQALRKIGVLDETTRAELTTTLAGNSQADRRLAAEMLAAGGVPAEVVLPTLVELAQDDPKTVGDMLQFLADCQLASAAASATDFAVAQLTASLPADDQREYYARTVLAKIGPAAVGKLIEALDHPSPRSRALAAKALGEIGPAAKGAVPRLICLLEDRERAGRLGDRWDFWDDDWLPIGGFEMSTPMDVRDFAVTALGKIGPDSREAVPRLARLLEERLDETAYHDHHRALLTAWTLGQIGPDALRAVPALIRLAKHDQEPPGATAAVALARIDPAKPAVIECLKWYLATGERRGFYESNHWSTDIFGDYYDWEDVLVRILDVLRELGLQAKPLVPDLRLLLDSPLRQVDTRCRAAYALASFPAERSAAVRYLKRIAVAALGHESEEADKFLDEIKASHHHDR